MIWFIGPSSIWGFLGYLRGHKKVLQLQDELGMLERICAGLYGNIFLYNPELAVLYGINSV
jgi:hypothetical protein